MDNTVPALESWTWDKSRFEGLSFLVDLKTQSQPIWIIHSTDKTIAIGFEFHPLPPKRLRVSLPVSLKLRRAEPVWSKASHLRSGSPRVDLILQAII